MLGRSVQMLLSDNRPEIVAKTFTATTSDASNAHTTAVERDRAGFAFDHRLR
jgi:hypothetical protein